MKNLLIIAIAALTLTACTKEIDIQGHYVTEKYYNMGVLIPDMEFELTLENGNCYFYDPASGQEVAGTYTYDETTLTTNMAVTIIWQYTFEDNRLILWTDYERWELVR